MAKHKLLTASGLPRARRCQLWLTPEVEWSAVETTSPEARLGSAFHAAMADILKQRRVVDRDFIDAIADIWDVEYDDLIALVEAVDLGAIIKAGESAMTEVAFAYDTESGDVRLLELPGPRQYELGEYEIGLTIDFIIDGGELVVGDWKTGYGRGLDPLSTNLQIRVAGLVAATYFSRDKVNIRIVRVNTDGVEIESDVMTAFDFDATAAEIRAIIARIPTAGPLPGPWCQYCPAAVACPAISKAIVEVIEPPPPPTFRLAALPADDAEAAYRLAVLPLLKAAVDRFEDGLKQYADARGGFPTAAGKVYRRVEGTRESVELNPGAIEWLKLELGDRFDEAVKLTTSKSAIEGAIKAIGKSKSVVDTAIVQLRGLGAIKSSPTVTYKEVKA